MTASEVQSLLEEVVDPILERDIVDLGTVLDCQVTDDRVTVTLFSGGPGVPAQQAIVDQVFEVLEEAGYTVELHAAEAPVKKVPAHRRDTEDPIINPRVSNYVPIVGPKGGVGKTMIAVNLAIGLTERGIDTGIVSLDLSVTDLNFYFPERENTVARRDDGNGWQPASVNGLKVLSVRDLDHVDIYSSRKPFWTTENRAEAVRQLVTYPTWGELEYLIVDLPPGGFDKITRASTDLPGPGALLVTTPRDPTLNATKEYAMVARAFDEKELPYRVMGIVENKSGTVCPACQTVIDPPMEFPETCELCGAPMNGAICPECWFMTGAATEAVTVECPACGTAVAGVVAGGGRALAREHDVPFLGRIPRDPAIQTQIPQTHEPAIHRESPGADALETVLDNVIDAAAAYNRHTFSEWRADASEQKETDWIERAVAAAKAEEPLTAPPVQA